jgi:hypothetical protein
MAKTSAKQTTPKKGAAKKSPVANKVVANKVAAKKKSPRRAAARPQPLPRPTITAEEKLFLLFKDDYHARQIFDFLRAETVGELEQFTPRAIVARLSKPIEDAVERIRHKLAEKNRYLAGDEGYLLRVRSENPGG